MAEIRKVNAQELGAISPELRCGDKILLSGTVYTARDAAHKRFAPRLLDLGLAGMIGKGERSKDVRDAVVRNKAVYLCAVGGAGALACKCITSCEVVAFDELGCESVKRLTVKDFPLVVADDCYGGDIFESGRAQYKIG